MKLKTNDIVQVVIGKDKGKQGKITKVLPKLNRVIVEGINKYKRHVKSRGKDMPGGIVEIERPLDASKVQFVSPHTKTITRIGYQISKTGEKTRIDKKTGKAI